jgi:acetyl-CoA C-acetyltransferase
MGQTAEILAHRFRITRAEADAYAVESHKRLAAAHEEGRLPELYPMIARNGKVYDHDDGVRGDNSVEHLAKLKPAFERPFGQVTAGNSSQITDGACWTILASEEMVKRHDLKPLARIVDCVWSGLDPSIMGLGPVLASTELLQAPRAEARGHRRLGAQRGLCRAGARMPSRLAGQGLLPDSWAWMNRSARSTGTS